MGQHTAHKNSHTNLLHEPRRADFKSSTPVKIPRYCAKWYTSRNTHDLFTSLTVEIFSLASNENVNLIVSIKEQIFIPSTNINSRYRKYAIMFAIKIWTKNTSNFQQDLNAILDICWWSFLIPSGTKFIQVV